MDVTNGISRRSLLKGAALAGGAAVVGGLLSGCAQEDAIKWDKETDVLVIGYGGAGSNVAICAKDAGADVLIIEKMAVGGGNTTCSLGGFINPTDADKTYTYICELFNVSHAEMSDELVRAFSDKCVQNVEWIKSLDGSLELAVYGGAGFPNLDGADSQEKWRIVVDSGTTGDALFNTYVYAVENQRGIEILYNTPAKELILNTDGKVIGVQAEQNGQLVNIKANKAVALTCGGYEYDENLKANAIKGFPIYALGNPGNSGDGIRMAQKVGADIWHMNTCSAQLGFHAEDSEAAFKLGFKFPNYFWVNKTGKRFVNEPTVEAHSVLNNMDIYDADPNVLEYPNNPLYLIFDETARLNGAICTNYAYSRNAHVWSDDNSEEIKKGWIKTADNFEGLASELGLDSAILAESADIWNAAVADGADNEFGRAITKTSGDKTTIVSGQLITPPFYGIELRPALFHTGGGARRNAKGQVLDPFGNPIPHLYSAGEFGSLWGSIYQGAGMNAEAIVSGRIAGENAALEESWSESK